MKKLTLALVALLASLTVSQAIPQPTIGETEKELTARFRLAGYWPITHIQFFGYPAIQAAGAAGKMTAIFSPKTGREIALVYSLRMRLTYADITGATNTYGRWQPVRDNPKLASWYLKHPRLGDLWMVVTAEEHVLIIATPEGLKLVMGSNRSSQPRKPLP